MSRVMMETPTSWFGKLGGSSVEGSSEYQFRLRVLVPGYRVTPRHSMFQYFLEMGKMLIPKILRHEPLGFDKGANLLFVFPERWMSVHEQQLFISRLQTHSESPNLNSVDIITQEVLIVAGCSSKSVALFQLSDDDPERGLISSDVCVD